jgi:hypothetical protein
MMQHMDHPSGFFFAAKAVNNLVAKNIQYQQLVCASSGATIVTVLRRHFSSAKTFIAAGSALGNLAGCPENVPSLLDQGLEGLMVTALTQYDGNMPCVLIALGVLTNLSAVRDLKLLNRLLQEAVISSTIACCRSFQHRTEVVIACLNTLRNLSALAKTADHCVDGDCLELVLDSLSAHDWDVSVVEAAHRVLGHLCSTQKGFKRLMDLRASKQLISCFKQHKSSTIVQQRVLMVLNIILSEEGAAILLAEEGWIEVVFTLLNTPCEDEQLILAALQVINKFAVDDEVSTKVAEDGMHVLMKLLHENGDNVRLLVKVFKLLNTLAFEEENLNHIVQHGGIDFIVSALHQ